VSAWDSVWQRVPLGCWNWFDTRNGRAQQEAASIVAALVALHFPQRFAAMVTHSGVEPTLAHSAASAVSSMRESQRVQPQLPTRTVPQDLPALLVIQGSATAAPGQTVSADPQGPDASRMAWAFALRQFEHRVNQRV
jgi:hypothetical protein